jgi:hypothetical protein
MTPDVAWPVAIRYWHTRDGREGVGALEGLYDERGRGLLLLLLRLRLGHWSARYIEGYGMRQSLWTRLNGML